jgi:hypothetical protein
VSTGNEPIKQSWQYNEWENENDNKTMHRSVRDKSKKSSEARSVLKVSREVGEVKTGRCCTNGQWVPSTREITGR